MPPLNTHADISSRARGLLFGLDLSLNLYFIYMRSEDSGKPAQMCRLARAFAARRCDKYLTHLCCPYLQYNRFI